MTCMASAWDSFLEFLEVDQIGLETEAGKLGRAVLSAMVYGFILSVTQGKGLPVAELRRLEEQVILYAMDHKDQHPSVVKVAQRWAT